MLKIFFSAAYKLNREIKKSVFESETYTGDKVKNVLAKMVQRDFKPCY